jgi:2-dehydropantoate 2-reductase
MELFQGTAIRIEEDPEFLTAAWRKFLINLAANPLTALVGRGIGALRGPEMENLALKLLEEAAAVGRAEGAKLGPGVAREVLDWMAGFPADMGTSMLEDRLAGRPLEYDVMTGTVVRLGVAHGIPMPVNETVLALLKGIRIESAGA